MTRPRTPSPSAMTVAARGALAQDRQLADVVARRVGPERRSVPSARRGRRAPALDDDEQLVADLALADERLPGRVDVLDRRPSRSAGGPPARGRSNSGTRRRQSIVSRSPRVRLVSGISLRSCPTRRARPRDPRVVIIDAAGRARLASCTSIASSSSSRTRARGARRSPIESRASIAWARTSGSSDRRQRRMTPPASGAPRTDHGAKREPDRARARVATRTAAGSRASVPAAGRRLAPASVARARRSSVARTSRPRPTR